MKNKFIETLLINYFRLKIYINSLHLLHFNSSKIPITMNSKKIFRQDYNQTRSLVKAGKISGENAVRRSKALNLVVTYIENGIVYEEQPDGSKKQIEVLVRKPAKIILEKGMVFHGK